MSVVKSPYPERPELGQKVVLPRTSPELWTTLELQWAGEDPTRWKALGVLHLYVHCHWSVEMIGRAFNHPKGHVSRILKKVKTELSERFEQAIKAALQTIEDLDEW